MTRQLMLIALIAMLGACGNSPVQRSANSPSNLAIVSVAPFLADAGSEDAQRECSFQRQLPLDVASRAKELGIQTRLFDSDESIPAGTSLLRMETVAANIRGGRGFTGDKWAIVRGTLMRDGQLVGNFRIRESVGSGSYGACKTFDELSGDMSKRIAVFLREPQKNYEYGY